MRDIHKQNERPARQQAAMVSAKVYQSLYLPAVQAIVRASVPLPLVHPS
jgi:hypothetical protein